MKKFKSNYYKYGQRNEESVFKEKGKYEHNDSVNKKGGENIKREKEREIIKKEPNRNSGVQ